jgi:hypothetical protein
MLVGASKMIGWRVFSTDFRTAGSMIRPGVGSTLDGNPAIKTQTTNMEIISLIRIATASPFGAF